MLPSTFCEKLDPQYREKLLQIEKTFETAKMAESSPQGFQEFQWFQSQVSDFYSRYMMPKELWDIMFIMTSKYSLNCRNLLKPSEYQFQPINTSSKKLYNYICDVKSVKSFCYPHIDMENDLENFERDQTYYKNGQLLVSVPEIAKDAGVKLLRYSFSESQSGKAEADREAGRMKQRIKIQNGAQMLFAITSGTIPLSGLTVTLAKLNYVAVNSKATIPFITSCFDFIYEENSIHYWKHFNIGPGKKLKQQSFDRAVIKPTLTIIEEWDHYGKESYVFWMPTKNAEPTASTSPVQHKTENNLNIDPEETSNYDPNMLFSCPVANCIKQFHKEGIIHNHMLRGKHQFVPEKYTLQKFAVKVYINKLEGGVRDRRTMANARNLNSWGSDSDVQPNEGWALRTTNKGFRYTTSMREFLDAELEEYVRNGVKPNTKDVATRMAACRNPDNKRCFTAEQRLNDRQIAAYFKRKVDKIRARVDEFQLRERSRNTVESDRILTEMAEEEDSLVPKSVLRNFEIMKLQYDKIKAVEEDDEKWVEAILEVDDKEFVEHNIEFRLGQDLTNKKLWKIYLEYLKSQDQQKLLQVYSKYCRFFLEDTEMLEKYKNAAGDQKVHVPWKNAFDFEMFQKGFYHRQHEYENDSVFPKVLQFHNNINNNAEKESIESKQVYGEKIANYWQDSDDDESDVQKAPLLCCFNAENSLNQRFPFRSTLMNYLLKNASVYLLHDFFKSCKWFYLKNPVSICYKFEAGRSTSIEIKEQCISVSNFSSLSDNLSPLFEKLFISTNLSIKSLTSPIDLIPRIYHCTAKYVTLCDLTFTDEELQILVGYGNVLDLSFDNVKNSYDEYFKLENILEMLPKLKTLSIFGIQCTPETSQKLCQLPFERKIENISLSNIYNNPEPQAFAEFINKHVSPKSEVLIYFNLNIDQTFFINFELMVNAGMNEFWNEKEKPAISFGVVDA